MFAPWKQAGIKVRCRRDGSSLECVPKQIRYDMKSGKVRIIGGEWRRRGLSFPAVDALRPTPDAVRETLFNWLMPYIFGRHCLDLYAGSGALAFEAVSRGAAAAVMVEKNARAATALKQNCEMIGAQNKISVTRCSAMDYLSTTDKHFDLIFLDPPFAGNELEKACYQIEKHGLIAPSGLIYLEHARDAQAKSGLTLPASWQKIKAAQRGAVAFALYQNSGAAVDQEV